MNRKVAKLQSDERGGKWWKDIRIKSGKKWDTMVHNGVVFTDPYKPLPKSVKIKYNGKNVTLDSLNTDNPLRVTEEEAAVFFATQLERDRRLKDKKKDHVGIADDPVFQRNFFNDWKTILGPKSIIKDFSKVDFRPISAWISGNSEVKKARRKAMTKEEKTAEKTVKKELKDLYGYALIDGIAIPVGNFTIQPPGLYMGHGKHPLRGKIKKRIEPSDITLNVSLDNIPECKSQGKSCKWGNVVENREVTWIATWKHPITNSPEYVWLNRGESHWVLMEDIQKFEKARNLQKNIKKIRSKYSSDMKSTDPDIRMLATAVYLLDVLAIRPGTEKDDEKESGTLGLTTLKCENIKLSKGNTLTVDFTGKSSIQFTKTLEIRAEAYKNLKDSCKSSKASADIFPFTSTTLNSYLKTLMDGLSAKVFRTWKASSTLQQQLDEAEYKIDDPDYIKKCVYNSVSVEVAKALNHKRMTNNDDRILKLEQKLEELESSVTEDITEAKKRAIEKSVMLTTAKLEEAMHNISTSTSKINYLDPRITVAWAKKSGTPIEKLYNKTQLRKFIWSMETESDWIF